MANECLAISALPVWQPSGICPSLNSFAMTALSPDRLGVNHPGVS